MERRLAAILAADVVGYSRLMEADEEGTHARLQELREQFLDPTVACHHGRIVKLTGDGALVEFPSVVQAVQCGVAIQRGMAARSADLPPPLRIVLRIGINLGDVMVESEDVYGTGVNVAARLEGLADPGGILISGTAYDQVEGRLDCSFAFLGEREVKNIARPVRIYRALLDDAPSALAPSMPASRQRWWAGAAVSALLLVAVGGAAWMHASGGPSEPIASKREPPRPLPSIPSIAVLPFENLNDDAAQDLFIDAMTNDITTDLSRFSTLFVIAPNSARYAKETVGDAPDIARDLGVRYLLEGSVQRAGETLRINAQLVDATTGSYLWAERYDREIDDLFAVQNEITREVVAVIAPLAEGRGRLQKAELSRIALTPTENLAAYDYYLQGIVYYDRFNNEDNLRARQMFEKAEDLDPRYARAISAKAKTYLVEYYNGWGDSPGDSLAKAAVEAERSIAMDAMEPLAHRAIATVNLWRRNHDMAIRSFQTAISLNPNDANLIAEYGWTLSYAGRTEEGVAQIEKAMRLNPHYPGWYLWNLAWAYFIERRYADAARTLEQRNPKSNFTYLLLAASYRQSGNEEAAERAMARFREREPGYSVALAGRTEPFKDRQDLEHFLNALRQAGLPEEPSKPGA
jgi:adenylate cyclase